MKKAPKISDIAEKADVSIATVSHVINKTRYVSPELIEKVEQVMKDLNYSPAARKKKRKRTNTIGLIIPDSSDPILAELANHISNRFFGNGYTVIVCNSMYDINKEIEFLKTLREKMVDGIMILPASDNIIDGDAFNKSRIPIVVIDREIRNIELDTIGINNEDICTQIVDSLYELGHRNFGYIDREYDLSHSLAKRRGFETALAKHKLQLNRNLIVRATGFNYEDGYKAAGKLFDGDIKPSVLICLNDVIAIGAMKKLSEMGLKIPEDVSVVGFGDIPVAKYLSPALTTFAYPSGAIAAMACDILIKKISDPFFEEIHKPVVALDDIIIRDSVGELKKQQ